MSAPLLEDGPAVLPDDVASAHHLARQLGQTTLVSRIESLPVLPDPIAFLQACANQLGHGVLWEQSATGFALAGAGIANLIAARGDSRFGSAASAIANLAARIVRQDGERFPSLGGFAFAPAHEDTSQWLGFPDARLVIPRVLLQIEDGAASVRITLPVDPDASPAEVESSLTASLEKARRWAHASLPVGSQPTVNGRYSVPERSVWESSVAAAVSMIQNGHIAKVVLAREERLLFADAVSPVAVLARLRDADPAATRFALQAGGAWFVGSTPERLVRLRDRRVDVTCLAGSIAVGRDDEESGSLAAQLLASAKDRDEHDIVVRATTRALADVCEDVAAAPGAPTVVKARSVQHLETPIVARMPHAGHVLDLVERLHPTPAVGGFPRDRALHVIRELEGIDRGWYAGPFGWTDLRGDGEFAVAIRSALLTGRTASLFAGCGIVAGSNPTAEWDETSLKLRPMLAALGVA